jgi:hypothetical protein
VKWLTIPEDIAILNGINLPDRFEDWMYHFGNERIEMEVRFLNFLDGKYRWRIPGEKTRRITINMDNREI